MQIFATRKLKGRFREAALLDAKAGDRQLRVDRAALLESAEADTRRGGALQSQHLPIADVHRWRTVTPTRAAGRGLNEPERHSLAFAAIVKKLSGQPAGPLPPACTYARQS